MSDVVIRAESLGKKYTIGHQSDRERYHALRDVMARNLKGLWQNARDLWSGKDVIQGEDLEEFWALKDVSFEIKQGEAVGIIGRNGAGKSTLLKVLSRITEPSAGKVTIKGRVASLLEVGTGFHPELTGRENIYLNGAILGMSRREMISKFDEIVDFAGVEKFLDTPVKRYSSGMYVRLAFAVAAHVENEILLVDEVLAVGDTEFQKKCMGRLENISRKDRTILFVSHNMVAVKGLCESLMVLDSGTKLFAGKVTEGIDEYFKSIGGVTATSVVHRNDRKGSQRLRFTHVSVHNDEGVVINTVSSGQNILVRLHYESQFEKTAASVLVSFNLRNSYGFLLANLNSYDSGFAKLDIHESGFFECRWPRLNLRSGSYECNLFCAVDEEIVDWMQHAFVLEIVDGDYYLTGRALDRSTGEIFVDHSWRSEKFITPR